MTYERFLIDALRVAVVLGLALAAMPLLRRAPSSTRRLVLVVALFGALVLPAVSALAPAWPVAAPAGVARLRGIVVAEPLAEGAPLGMQASPMPAATAAPARSHVGIASALAVAWALGALIVVGRLAVGLVVTGRIVRRAVAAPAWSGAVARACEATGCRAVVRETGELEAPAVAGVWRPVVLVPRGSERWSDDRRYAVLLHELAHVRQRDCLVNVVAQLACAMHWFDPLAWVAARRLRFERELAADDAVLAAGARASSYAEDLVAIAEGVAARCRVPSGALGMAERSQLVARVTALIAAGRARRPLSAPRAALLVAALLAVLLGVACATPAPTSASVTAPAAAERSGMTPDVRKAASTSTVDPRLQAIADEEVERVVREWEAAAGAIVVLDPSTGEVLADAGREAGRPADVAVKRAYVTGSTLKMVTLAAALDSGVLAPGERFDCEHGAFTYAGDTMHDANPYGSLTVAEMLAVSSNVGFTKVFDRLGAARLTRAFHAFHFGEAPPIDGAEAGALPAPFGDKTYAGAVAAIGEALVATPLQMAAAYGAVANGGVYVPPTLTHRKEAPPRDVVMKPETARTVVAMLDEVVNGERGTGKPARVAGVRVAGKTGTAAWERPDGHEGRYASFVGLVPEAAPRFVVLVGVEQPRDDGTGGTVAAPAFARVASRALGVH